MQFTKSPFIIGVLQQKGGVGKTTLTLNLAAYYAEQGLRVLVVDADPQGSAITWSSTRDEKPPFAVISMAKPTLHRDLPEIAANYECVLIDGAPRVNDLARSAILASDFILIPVQPSSFDFWAAQETVELIREAQQFRLEIKAAFVVNRKIAKTVISRAVAKGFKEQAFAVLPTEITQRVAFAEAATSGLTIIELEPKGAAAREIRNLARDIFKQQQEQAV